MTELLDDLDVLTQPRLDLRTLSLDGVRYGSSAAVLPRHRIVHVSLSPVVARARSGRGIDSQFWAADGRELTLDEVIDSVVEASGVVHFDNETSFRLSGGVVVGFTIYGELLTHFSHLRSYEQFLAAFGMPDRVEVSETTGNLMGYTHYWGSWKSAYWDSWDDRLSHVHLGGDAEQPWGRAGLPEPR